MRGRLAFDLMFALGGDHLRRGLSVVLDTTSDYPTVPERSAALAEAHRVPLLFLECTLDDDRELERRLTSRRKRSSQMSRFDVTPEGSTAEKIGTHRWRTYGPLMDGPRSTCGRGRRTAWLQP